MPVEAPVKTPVTVTVTEVLTKSDRRRFMEYPNQL